VRNGEAIGRYSRVLADRLEAIVGDGSLPLVLGGDCSILLGAMLALRRRGRFGLVFLDAHSDFRHLGNARAVGAAAGEDLALVTGRGDELADLEGLGPLVRDEDVVAIGVREDDEALTELGSIGIPVVTPAEVRARGVDAVAAEAVARLSAGGVDGFWVHCDADVLDAGLMPAVDTPEPGGLDLAELAGLLRALLGSELAAGMELTIFDPDLDEDGALAERVAGCLVEAFRT
jgi:arginase